MSGLFDTVPLSSWEVRSLARVSRVLVRLWLWLLLPWFGVCLVSTAIYYGIEALRDDLILQAVPGLSPSIRVMRPRQLFAEDTTYTITLDSTGDIKQPIIISLLSAEGVMLEPRPQFSFPFSPNMYQTYKIQVKNKEDNLQQASLTFTDNISTKNPIVLNVDKAHSLHIWWRQLFVITSLAGGIIPILIPAVTLLLSTFIQRGEQAHTRELFADLREKAQSFKHEPQIPVLCEKLSERRAYLSDSEKTLVENLYYLDEESFFRLIDSPTVWEDEYIGMILASNKRTLVDRLYHIDLTRNILSKPQRDEVDRRRGIDQSIQIGFGGPIRYGEQFRIGAERAERDDPENFTFDALPDEDQIANIVDTSKIVSPGSHDHQWSALLICGEEGSGKTATLYHAKKTFEDSSKPPLCIILPPESVRDQKVFIREIIQYLYRYVWNNPKAWDRFPSETKHMLLNLFQQALNLSPNQLDTLARRGTPISWKRPGRFRRFVDRIWYRFKIGSPAKQVAQAIQQINSHGLVVCFDNAEADTHIEQIQKKLASLPLPTFAVIAYRTATPDDLSPLPDDTKLIHLLWTNDNGERLGKILSQRTKDPFTQTDRLDETVRQHLVQQVHVPRDFWPWWRLLTHPHIGLDPANTGTHVAAWRKVEKYLNEVAPSSSGKWTVVQVEDVIARLGQPSNTGATP